MYATLVCYLGSNRQIRSRNGVSICLTRFSISREFLRDLAEASAAVLAGEGHEGRSYILSGDEAVSMADIAVILSDASGKQVDYKHVSAANFIETSMKAGAPEPFAVFMSSWFEAIAAGEFSEITGDLHRLLGRAPTNARTFLTGVYKPA